MTVSYTSDIANGGKFVCFWRVLIRWRGSLYKLIWQDLLWYCVLFAATSYLHTYALSAPLQHLMQRVRGYVSTNFSMFPVPFVLSFFVDQVATKWWHQYNLLPSPDTLAIYTNATIPGRDDQSRLMRRTIVRYAVLSLVLTLRNISVRIKKRFPTIKHVQEAGLILEDETIHYVKLEEQVTANNWMPLVWAANVATHARTLQKVSSDQCLRLLISELTAHRDKLGTLVGYDLVNIPLVYTQTMVVVVISYVLITLVSHQPGFSGPDFTVSSLVDFIIFVGLMKVATVMLNPFGEDDDDFELNATVDRHITAAYMIVDEMHEEEPEVVKDTYWDEIVPKELPYTVGSVEYRRCDPNVYEEPSQTKKQEGKKFSFRSQRSWHHQTDAMGVVQNHLVLNNLNFPQNRHSDVKVNRINCSINVGSQLDDDVYECPDPNIIQKQLPGTSKQRY